MNVVDRRATDDRYTHYFAKEELYSQLDYILVSRDLAAMNKQPPDIYRNGQTRELEFH